MTTPYSGSLPARESIDIPIAFEGSMHAGVAILTSKASLAATLDGMPLVLAQSPESTVTSYTVTLSAPLDGDLHVTNTGTVAITITVVLQLETSRHLTVESGSRLLPRGATTDIEVTISTPVAGDDVAVQVVRPDGSQSPLTIHREDQGRWTGEFSATVAGEHRIVARTTGNGSARYGAITIEVMSGAVTVGPPLSERLDDSDADGLADALVVSAAMTVTTSGAYHFVATLVDGAGVTIGQVVDDRELPIGSSGLELSFDGAQIYASGSNGPYRLSGVRVSTETGTAAMAEDLGATPAYDRRIFQHKQVVIEAASISSTGVDIDGDGRYEYLRISGTVSVDTAGAYVVNGGLYPTDELLNNTPITFASSTLSFDAGSNAFSLDFEGKAILASTKDGPYEARGILVYRSDQRELSDSLTRYLTGDFTVDQFAN